MGRIRKSISFKILGSYLSIIILFSLFCFIFTTKAIRKFYIANLTRNLTSLAISLRYNTIAFLKENRIDELQDYIKEVGRNTNTLITVINPEGKVLADSKYGLDIEKARLKEKMLYVELPVKEEGKVVAVMRIGLLWDEINKSLNVVEKDVLGVISFLSLLALLIGIIFSQKLAKPVKELVNISQRLSSGEPNLSSQVESKDELRTLKESFNFIAERIRGLSEELSFQKEKLSNIISSLRDGLILLDKEDKIMLSNESFKKFVQNNAVEGKFYWEVIRDLNLRRAIEEARKSGDGFTREIRLNERIFLSKGIVLRPREEIILTFSDLTEVKNLEKIKKDFVANVSHELKTPLTAIKGYIETVEEEVQGGSKHYLGIVKKHADRLINIVNDLLRLAELEEVKELEVEDVNLKNLLDVVSRMFENQLKKKDLYLKLEISEDLPPVKGDYFKLEQMFINLIDNAIKYTDKGGITIRIKREAEEVKIEVEDTGIGILEEDRERIFERFYVADKSRSRQSGGTGLGLSIVKHIVLLHKGKIDVESQVGKGTKFIISLPLSLA